MTETTKNRRYVPIEERSAAYTADLEWETLARWSQGWTVAAILATVAAVYTAGGAAYTVAGQLATVTDLIRPLPDYQAAWIQRQYNEKTPPTLQQLKKWTPEGWSVQFPARFFMCQENRECDAKLNHWTQQIRATPEVQRQEDTARKTGGVAVFLALVALFARHDVNTWSSFERRVISRDTREAL